MPQQPIIILVNQLEAYVKKSGEAIKENINDSIQCELRKKEIAYLQVFIDEAKELISRKPIATPYRPTLFTKSPIQEYLGKDEKKAVVENVIDIPKVEKELSHLLFHTLSKARVQSSEFHNELYALGRGQGSGKTKTAGINHDPLNFNNQIDFDYSVWAEGKGTEANNLLLKMTTGLSNGSLYVQYPPPLLDQLPIAEAIPLRRNQ